MNDSCRANKYEQCILHNTIDTVNLNLQDLITLEKHNGEAPVESVEEILSIRTLIFEYRESCFVNHHLNTCKWRFYDNLGHSTEGKDCVCSYILEKCKYVNKFFASKKKKLLKIRQLRQIEEKNWIKIKQRQ